MPRRTVPGNGKKVPLNMRTTVALRAKIDKAAGKSGRSLVQEVEYRVEMSFLREDYGLLACAIENHERRIRDHERVHCRIEDQLLKLEAMWADLGKGLDAIGKIVAHAVNVRNGTVGTPEELEWVHG